MTVMHSPGPWQAADHEDHPQDEAVSIVSRNGFVICQVVRVRDGQDIKADVSLISAAPELLAELKEAVEVIRACRIVIDAGRSFTNEQSRNAFETQTAGMRSAIAKAEGTEE